MTPSQARRTREIESVFSLQRRFPTLLEVGGAAGRPINRLDLVVRIPTAVDESFPARRRPACHASVVIPARHPFEPARVTIREEVFNPNIFPSGLLCFGPVWHPTWTLGDVVLRAMRILSLDPEIINCQEPACAEAAEWYQRESRRGRFPTVDLRGLEVPSGEGIVFRPLADATGE